MQRKISQQETDAVEHASDLSDELVRLERAFEDREVIGRATGIIMVEHRLSPEAADEMLSRMAKGEHMTVPEVAAMIVLDRTPAEERPDAV